MKKLAFCIYALLLNTTVAVADAPLFQPWCDAFTAQGMVSLAANRIFGRVSSLNDEQYEARSSWVDNSYKMAAERFTDRTGLSFEKVDMDAMRSGWVQRCQLKDQIQ